ncbi:MAG: fumarylacetoacetate hydrolase family protein [Alistipes sp.]|nr:fumarylacetoacetate hydrolase family protein [Alistipes sp.]
MKLICIGRNYAAHAAELNDGAELPKEPLFFLKPDTALLRNNDPFYIPSFSSEVHYECELVVRITRLAKCMDVKFASRCYEEVGLGIDFTARDLQREAIAKGLPWELCKGFDHSAALSNQFIPLSELGGDVQNLTFEMELNGELRQRGFTRDMLFSVDEIIAHVSKYMTLRIGDLIYTGTPVGVGAVKAGDNIKARLGGHTLLDFDIM